MTVYILCTHVQDNCTMNSDLAGASRERTSLQLKCEELGCAVEQLKKSLGAREQEKAEVIRSCHSLSEHVERLEADLWSQQESCAHAHKDIHALHQASWRCGL